MLTTMDDPATSVWNRACDYEFQPTRPGQIESSVFEVGRQDFVAGL
jgi:hypothetical protein